MHWGDDFETGDCVCDVLFTATNFDLDVWDFVAKGDFLDLAFGDFFLIATREVNGNT
jgi:hypothetical protein